MMCLCLHFKVLYARIRRPCDLEDTDFERLRTLAPDPEAERKKAQDDEVGCYRNNKFGGCISVLLSAYAE